jgi:hypothetical protein
MSNHSPLPELACDVARLVTSMMSEIRDGKKRGRIGVDLGLNTLPEINAAMSARQKFIAAGSPALADEIRGTLQP